MIRIYLFCFFASLTCVGSAQVFHFDNHHTTLIKNTSQSPAHWYIEIISDVTVDTTLRWKAHFDNVPTQWSISLDDQNNYYNNIQDNDSADFTLYQGLDFPQKLIIGAMLNNTAANCTAFFEIYNPENTLEKDTIYYHFIVSTVGLEELINSDILSYKNGLFKIENNTLTTFEMYDELGKLIMQKSDVLEFRPSNLKNELGFLVIKQPGKVYSIKWHQGM